MFESRVVCHALAAFAIAIAPGKTVWGQDHPDRKLDKKLQEAVANGCSGGPLRVIIGVKSGYRKGMRDSLESHGDKVSSEFKSIDALAAEVHCGDLEDLATMSETMSLSIDGPIHPHAAPVRKAKKPPTQTQGEAAAALQAPMFESTLAWPYLRAASYLGSPYTPISSSPLNETVSALMDAGMTGAAGGIGIAVIDSGIVAGPEFEHGITASYDFTRGGVEASAPVDPYGHGTHVAGLIAGANVGIAPGARVIGLRVLDGKGKGTTSDVLRAIEFAIANKTALNLHVINLSLGHPIYEAAATDPLVQAVESAVRNGLVVSVSAGNFGTDESTGEPAYAGVASPGNSPSAITSGSTNMFDTTSREDDRVSAFSSRGPTRHDGFLKPDLVSPGENVLSVAAVGSRLRGLQETRGNTGDYMRLSGTSMAAAVTSGVIALTLNVNPNLTANALKAILQYSAIPVLNSAGDEADLLTQGAGQINGGGAIALAWVIVADAPIGSKWLKPGYPAVYPSTEIAGTEYEWSQSILWGGRTLSGADLMLEQRPAWAANIVWGEGLGTEDDNIVWGNNFGDDDNIVWGNNIVWGSDDDNIVWGNNIVWGSDDDNIVWGNTVPMKSSRKGRKR